MHSIKVNDKTYSFCWGLLTFVNTCDKLDISLPELHQAIALDKPKPWYHLAYQALLTHDETSNNGANTINGELDGFSYLDFMQWFDEQPQEVGDQIIDDYKKSVYLGKTMQERYDEVIEKLNIALEEQNEEANPTKKKNVRSVK